MEKLISDLNNLLHEIRVLENKIHDAEIEVENNIKPLNNKLSKIREDKRLFASKQDFDSIQSCIRREDNLKFKINAQWNEYSLLKDELIVLNRKKHDLEYQLQLEKDKIKRNDEILSQMKLVLNNYRESQNLKQAALDSNIKYDYVKQWFEWGRNNYNETYAYFHNQVIEIDDYFKDLKAQELKNQMDKVINAYQKTNSLKKACEIADVSYDTAEYWYEWGSHGFGEENTYFFKRIKELS